MVERNTFINKGNRINAIGRKNKNCVNRND